jgi:hypothetical protein
MSAVAPIKPDPAAPSKGPGTPAVRRIADLPGPKGWPVLGNLPQIKAAEFHLQLERWAHEYGRYFQIRMAIAICWWLPTTMRWRPCCAIVRMDSGAVRGWM